MLTIIPPPPPYSPKGPRPSQKTVDAVRLVLEGGWSIYAAAKKTGACKPSISRRVRAIREGRVEHRAEDSENYAAAQAAERAA